MKKTLVLSLICSALMIFAQNARAVYQYTFAPDAAKKDSTKTEWMYLDITKNGSLYYSKKSFESDSVIAASLRQQVMTGSRSLSVSRKSDPRDVNFKVEKTYPGFETFLEQNVGTDNYRIAEDRPMDWKISSEKAQIGEFTAQKAETDFAGRHWIAWFTTEVPFQDGPYKFHGLPGLIVKAEDQTGTHIMELKALKKNFSVSDNEVKLPEGKSIPLFGGKPIAVTRKQYLKKLEEYERDPVQGMREMLNRPNSKVVVNINGQQYTDPKDILRQMEKSAREQMKQNSNRIELQP